jgi:hypothetical protein
VLTVFHGVQMVVLAAIALVVVERVRALFFRGPVDVEPLVRAVEELPRDRAAALLAELDAFAARAMAAALEAPDRDREIVREEALADAKEAIQARLQAVRVAATLSSFLGFVGAAIELAWVHSGDHGLLGLDPTRVAALGTSRAAISIALGVAGSSFALGAWMALRKQATRLVGECERAVDRRAPAA